MILKRLFDIVVSAFLIAVLSPIMGLIAVAILVADGFPVMFRQERVGRTGKPFVIVKFRSMRAALGTQITASGDSRVTYMGGILRHWKLDELPQLFNVLWGDMSLVGPRPEVPLYVSSYSEEQRRVLSVRPGLTDWASIRFRDEESVLARYPDKDRAYREIILPEKLRLNLRYVAERSFLVDLGIIASTVGAILFPRLPR